MTGDAEERARLRRAFVDRATAEGLIDVAYRSLDTPLGELLLAATSDGVVRVAFQSESRDTVLQELADVVSPRILEAPAMLDRAAGELTEYFEGRRRTFDLEVDLRLSRGYRQEVLKHLQRIPFGETRSYSAIASSSGHPGASRAVGTACASNPVPLIVPCHRVVRSDGSIGNYAGGAEAKRFLLDLEAD
jgi:methylated-DNA-[protein]-cysteine S-methyltransferase